LSLYPNPLNHCNVCGCSPLLVAAATTAATAAWKKAGLMGWDELA